MITSNTHTMAALSVAGYSWSKKKMSIFSGMGMDRAASAFMMVDLPLPLGPRKPYLQIGNRENQAC